MSLITHILTTEPAKSPLAYGLAALTFAGVGVVAAKIAWDERKLNERIGIAVFSAISFLLTVVCYSRAKVLYNAIRLS